VTNCSGSASTPGSLPYEAANAGPGDTVTFALAPACSTKPGKKLTIKGADLSQVTGVTIGGVTARILKTAPTKVSVTVPAGARSGVVRVTSSAGVSTSSAVVQVTSAGVQHSR
jgi:hypothetical protein